MDPQTTSARGRRNLLVELGQLAIPLILLGFLIGAGFDAYNDTRPLQTSAKTIDSPSISLNMTALIESPTVSNEIPPESNIILSAAYSGPSRSRIYRRRVVRRRRRRSVKKQALIVGGSAAGGAAIGALAGGGKGAAIGAVSGGAAGLIYNEATKNKRK